MGNRLAQGTADPGREGYDQQTRPELTRGTTTRGQPEPTAAPASHRFTTTNAAIVKALQAIADDQKAADRRTRRVSAGLSGACSLGTVRSRMIHQFNF